MLRVLGFPSCWPWASIIAAAMVFPACDPVRCYAAPGRTPVSVLPPRSESLGERAYDIPVAPQVTYRLHGYWFSGVVNLVGELDNTGAVPILVDDSKAALQLEHGLRVRAAALSREGELFNGEVFPNEKHKTHYKFAVPTLEAAADLMFVHEGLNATSGEALPIVVHLVDADTL